MLLVVAVPQRTFTCSKTTEQTHQNKVKDASGVFVVNFEQISHDVLALVSFVYIEQVNTDGIVVNPHSFIPGISFASAAGIYLLKTNNTDTRTRSEICSKLTIKTLSLLLTLTIFHILFYCLYC